MTLHNDLLEQAVHLATRERTRPRQASLRRAVSTAYYALFHFLIAEAVAKWKVTSQRAQLARIFEHTRMNAASLCVLNERAFPFSGEDLGDVAHLKGMASTFRQLYESRQVADYDTMRNWTRTEVLELIDLATEAFGSIKATRKRPIINDYLLSLFVKDRR